MNKEWATVFVYGTLRRGERLHWALTHNNTEPAEFVGMGIVAGDLLMGVYPAAYPAQESGRIIVGEVWNVTKTTLMLLDQIEHHPRFYKREQSIVHVGAEGQTVMLNAWVYWSNFPRYSAMRRIANGDYIEYSRKGGQ